LVMEVVNPAYGTRTSGRTRMGTGNEWSSLFGKNVKGTFACSIRSHLIPERRNLTEDDYRQGLDADLTIGPAFPAMVPGLSPDSPGSAKELVYGKSDETYATGNEIDLSVLPQPISTEAGRTPANSVDQKAKLNLLAVYAARVVVNDQQSVEKEQGSMVIDVRQDAKYLSSVIDITKHFHDAAKYTFPDHDGKNSRWIVLAAYYRGTLQVSGIAACKTARLADA
jgi:hypothetical protein